MRTLRADLCLMSCAIWACCCSSSWPSCCSSCSCRFISICRPACRSASIVASPSPCSAGGWSRCVCHRLLPGSGSQRGYVQPGTCPSGVQPIVKPIGAVAGDQLEIYASQLSVNGQPLPHSATQPHDRHGRELCRTCRGAPIALPKARSGWLPPSIPGAGTVATLGRWTSTRFRAEWCRSGSGRKTT